MISAKEELILGLLAQGPRSGLELIEASEGVLSRGTVYFHLTGMKEKGLTTFTHEGRLRLWSLTDRGRTVNHMWQELKGLLS